MIFCYHVYVSLYPPLVTTLYKVALTYLLTYPNEVHYYCDINFFKHVKMWDSKNNEVF